MIHADRYNVEFHLENTLAELIDSLVLHTG